MKQHPVPQNIASYQFRLVGEMTLKQFLELAAGLGAAYLIFYLKIPFFVKWPLIVFFGLMGFALAFLPIQERPLDRWIINFIKSIYAPTRYLWRKNNQTPSFLQTKAVSSPLDQTIGKEGIPKDKSLLREYLATLAPAPTTITLDREEQKRLEEINKLWLDTKLTVTKTKIAGTVTPPTPLSQPVNQQPPKIMAAPPLTPPISVDTLFPVKQEVKPEVAALFPTEIAIPAPPEKPNLIIGMVVTASDRIIPNALIEIKDKEGNTLRALKTNKLGQFFTASPLENGEYTIHPESDEHQFDIIRFKAEGKIIPATKIKAKP
ncbi:MAG TPA: PrgI family protein [Candidatus Bathyarchaeia archaeon]|nr:PrgI family protein [Candidatus Bathyarchaeia archaeon]